MTSKTHDIAAFALLMTAAVYFQTRVNIMTAGVAVVANIVGALLPDVDQASNRLWDLLPGGDTLGKMLKGVLLGHRTLSHSLLGIFLVDRLLNWMIPLLFNPNSIDGQIVVAAVMIGYGSHLIFDALTEEGLPLLFPFKWKFGFPPIKRLRFKTDGIGERWLVFPGIVIYLGWLIYNHWQDLASLITMNR